VTGPGLRLLQYIAAALRSGKAYLLNMQDRNLEPKFPAECGWIKQHLFQGTDKMFKGSSPQVLTWQTPRGMPCLGYIDDELGIVYLDKVAAILVANQMAQHSGDTWTFTSGDVGRDLMHEKLCLTVKGGPKGKERSYSHKSIQGAKGYYLEILRDALMPPSQRIPVGDEFSWLTGENGTFSAEGLGAPE
jgi:hypothetical protein